MDTFTIVYWVIAALFWVAMTIVIWRIYNAEDLGTCITSGMLCGVAWPMTFIALVLILVADGKTFIYNLKRGRK